MRATGNPAAIAASYRACITRLLLQFQLCLVAFIVGALSALDRRLQCGTPCSEALHCTCTFALAGNHGILCHVSTSVPEREVESSQQGASFFVRIRSCCKCNIHTTQGIDLVVINFGENDLLFHAHVVVAATVK